MASSSSPLAERAEIHKSCKTLESVVNILNDYCEAANAIVQLQKKLAKALREAASPKCVNEIPANALNATATIFEAMAEVDSKFAKYADKECDNVSAEVKKWFKKLAKEERLHDEKIASSNTKIKQAGQIYERKAKKSPRDAAEEHTRYINLLSTLGPEINREKYNHALLVTEKHSSTMYSLAASFSRVADAEWIRGCESVRRFSPTIGPLGQWRALCEGGWSGSLPSDLPNLQATNEQYKDSPSGSGPKDLEPLQSMEGHRDLTLTPSERPAPQYSSRDASEQEPSSRAVTPGQSPQPPPQYFPPTAYPESAKADDGSLKGSVKEAEERTSVTTHEERNTHSTTLASLAAFPAPPTHFPPPPTSGSKFNSGPAAQSDASAQSTRDTRPELPQDSPTNITPFPRFTESPAPESASTPSMTEDSRSPPTPRTDIMNPLPSMTSPAPPGGPHLVKDVGDSPSASTANIPHSPSSRMEASISSEPRLSSSAAAQGSASLDRRPSPATNEAPNTPLHTSPSSYRRGDYADDAEFGVRRSVDSSKPRPMEPNLPKVVERSDTGKSNGSVVAALRDRYARTGGPSSPPPRELPRLPTSVSTLAHRYEPTSSTTNVSRQATGSPTQERARVSVDNYSRMPEPSPISREPPSSSNATRRGSVPPTPTSEEIALRRQRIEELEELEMREREHELRMKEREIEQRARELERERQQLLTARTGRSDGYVSDNSRGAIAAGRVSAGQRPSVDTLPSSRYPSSYSQSTSNLVPPPSSQGLGVRQPSSQPSSPGVQTPDHAPYCGCESCSASKYKARDVAPRRDSRPTEPPLNLRPDKPRGGWIRRLSMPVVSNAFSLDSKKNVNNVGIAGGPGYRNSLAFAEEDGRLYTDLTGGIRNRSSTNLARR
ncbi:hypothetical protein GY45DRAFT_164841 [Cubamyces sp. BRFM 1775]|nr:hypothetical protein GY45DRAFT_164841 [Cubamyces sp. BRFM 1775]